MHEYTRSNMYVQNTFEPSTDDARTQTGAVDQAQESREPSLDTEFLSNLAHQLRSPLSSLRVWVDLLKDPSATGSPDDLKKMVDGIERSTTRLERQITDILEAGYIQAGALTLKPEPIDVLDVVTEAISMSEQAAKAREISISLNSESLGLKANADRARLLQVISALISNSIKFSPVGSSVNVEITSKRPDSAPQGRKSPGTSAIAKPERVKPSIYVTVRDSGPGIQSELHREVFKPFYRTKRAGAPGGGGAGLGLVIALGLVRLHGGEMWVRSRSGEGAEFGFSVPMADESEAA